MLKLGLLKDSDFKLMHDRKLPVTADDYAEVKHFEETVIADVKFLEGLRIMDYSLFLIILEIPPSIIAAQQLQNQQQTNSSRVDNPSMVSAEEIKIQCNEIDLNQIKE
jgi:Phosphatidylinositol-4-phosphate 5-Kinase